MNNFKGVLKGSEYFLNALYIHNNNKNTHTRTHTVGLYRDANSALFGASRFFHVSLGDLCESCRSEEFSFRGEGGLIIILSTVILDCLHQTSK